MKLAVSEGDGGVGLLHCFGGCSAGAVLAAVGLELGELFPVPLPSAEATPADRAARRRAATEADWLAAIDVLDVEAAVVQIAAEELIAGRTLDAADRDRLALAHRRVSDAAIALRGARRQPTRGRA